MRYTARLPPYKRRRNWATVNFATRDGSVVAADDPFAWAIGLDIHHVAQWVARIGGAVMVHDDDDHWHVVAGG